MRIETGHFGEITSEQQRQEVLEEHKAESLGLPSVYVGTYRKYNNGSLAGMWVDLTSFSDYDEFIEFCAKVLHFDENEPELMAQDFENFPRELYDEGFIKRENFDVILAYSELKASEKDAFDAYCEIESAPTIETFRDCYHGKFDSKEEFARHFVEDTGVLHSIPEHLRGFFDFESYAEFVFGDCFEYVDGHVFLR